MPNRYISTKSIGRRIGALPITNIPAHDGDGDGFITNPITGEDDAPAPITAVIHTLAQGADKFGERMKSKYDESPIDGDGDCYVAAYNLLEKLATAEKDPEKRKRIRLVHGIPFGTGGDAEGRRFGHAWVEVDNSLTPAEIDERLKDIPENQHRSARLMMEDKSLATTVYDYSNGRKIELPQAVYYGLGRIDKADARYYTITEMRKTSLKFGHYGPWE